MKGIIIYKSNYGSTRQYAQWLSEETGFTALPVKSVKKKDIAESDRVIIGAPIFAGKPLLYNWIVKNWPLLSDKKAVLYTTSGASGDDPLHKKNFENFFEPAIREKMAYFPVGGRMIHSELKPLHRFLVNLGKKMVKDPVEREEMDRDKDHLDRNELNGLIQYLRES